MRIRLLAVCLAGACLSVVGCSTQALDKSVVDLQAMEQRLDAQAKTQAAEAARLQAQADALPADSPGKPAAVAAAAAAKTTAQKAESTHQAVAAGVTQLKDVQAQANSPPTVDPGAGVAVGSALGGPLGGFLGGAVVVGLPLLIKNRNLLAAATSIVASIQQVINANPHVDQAVAENAPLLDKVQTPLAKKIVDQVQADMAKDGQMPVVTTAGPVVAGAKIVT